MTATVSDSGTEWTDLDPYEVTGINHLDRHHTALCVYATGELDAQIRAKRDHGALLVRNVRMVRMTAKQAQERGIIRMALHEESETVPACSQCGDTIAKLSLRGLCRSCSAIKRVEREKAEETARYCSCGRQIAASNTTGYCLTCANQARHGWTMDTLGVAS